LAKIKVIKVNAYGSAFPVKFHPDEELMIWFVYSVKAVDNGKLKLPGIKRGDVFDAAVIAKQKMNSNVMEFEIHNYNKNIKYDPGS